MTTTKIWFAVDEDGDERVHDRKPGRDVYYWLSGGNSFSFPKGFIQAITGVTLSWQDEPLEWVVGKSRWIDIRESMPPYDGAYLCYCMRKEQCLTRTYYQDVLQCSMNTFIVPDNTQVFYWRQLPNPPESTVTLD